MAHPSSSSRSAQCQPQPLAHFSAFRPLVRYVDDQQAVLEFHLKIDWPQALHAAPEDGLAVELLARDAQGQHTRLIQKLSGVQGEGTVRFSMPDPLLWWPAGMGDQPLYDLTLRLMVNDEPADIQTTLLGLASVRVIEDVAGPSLLVHGRPCSIQQVVEIEPQDEKNILPAGAGSLMIVRHHFGSEALYEAADRAGILLIQGIPDPASSCTDPQAQATIEEEVARLTAHPSLAGWLVESADHLAQKFTTHLRTLDPTRAIFHDLPGLA